MSGGALPETTTNRTTEVPLVLDLDGTLVLGDTLHESLVALLRSRPLSLLQLPVWLLRGRSGFKQAVAERVQLDAGTLRYDDRVVQWIRDEGARREVVLATAAHTRIAEAVAEHVGGIGTVLASDGAVNLKGEAKAQALVARYGVSGFEYAGNDVADLPVFAVAHAARVVRPTARLARRLGRVGNRTHLLEPQTGSPWRAAVRAMRPLQWSKNLLVLLPALGALEAVTRADLVSLALTFVAFGLVASSVYVLNDLLDLGADRTHPRKRHRPLASGALSIGAAAMLHPLLLAAGFGMAWRAGPGVAAVLGAYWVGTNLYSFWFKRLALLDTLTLAGLYTLRVLAGAAAIGEPASEWLLAFSIFFFLSLAHAKRYAELRDAGPGNGHVAGRGYVAADASLVRGQGTASGYAAVLVLALFINSDAMRVHYVQPLLLWLLCPLLLYWMNKLWLAAHRGQLSDDPIVWAFRNRVSRGVGLLGLLLLLLARLA